ncbi:MAG: carboxypeptidase M32 [Fibrobacteria bacterium]|nr:carboxypeptidase M32 [Fibrobacteria bacterium]
MSSYEDLLAHLRETDHFQSAARLAQWDQETGMPPNGETARAELLATLARHVHSRSTSGHLRELLEKATQEASTDDQKRQCELVRRDLDRASAVPARLVEEIVRTTSIAQQAWSRARKARDFAAFLPHLREVVSLKREEGACIAPPGGTPYDGLLSDYERGMTTSDWDGLFLELEAELPGLVASIVDRQRDSHARLDACSALRGPFPQTKQMETCRRLATGLGFDFQSGRLDLSAHPFSETVHAGDHRITTRLDESDLEGSLFSSLHETGHALYEQGLPQELTGTPLGGYCSMSVHESQSRLWENLVGRSDTYWETEYPGLLKDYSTLGYVPRDLWLAAVRRVRPSLIRTESDEATYNLHVLVRFRLEKALVAGDLDPEDLPAAWNESYRTLLGVAPSHDAEGCLQDVHWSAGLFGYFPTYTLGNLLSCQIYEAAQRAGATNDRASLLEWLRRNIHEHGHRWETPELIERATGSRPSSQAFLRHIRSRYLPEPLG